MDIEIKFQACAISEALIRNINNNFINISFEILDNGDIQTKFILSNFTEQEKEYIDDFSVEFSAKQKSDCILPPIIEIGYSLPLKYLVYDAGSW